MSTLLSKFYQVRPDDTVTLKLTIGHGQVGTTRIALDQEVLVDDARNSVNLTLPHSGDQLKGKTLFCTTTVADVRAETNETSVTYELSGGAADFKQTLQERVDSEGAVVFYTATFLFI